MYLGDFMKKICIIGGDRRLKKVKQGLENENFYVKDVLIESFGVSAETGQKVVQRSCVINELKNSRNKVLEQDFALKECEDGVYNIEDDLLLFDPVEPWKKTRLKPGTFTIRELMVPVFLAGECVYDSPKVMEIRDYAQKELSTLWDETRRFANPHKVYVDLSSRLYDIKIALLDEHGDM